MPVSKNNALPPTAGPANFDREIARLRGEIEALRKQKTEAAAASGNAKLPLYLAALALLVSIIALFR